MATRTTVIGSNGLLLSSCNAKHRLGGQRALLIVVILLILCVDIVAAQDASSPRQPDGTTIQGTVLDSTGRPVGDALVRLELKGAPDAVTKTNRDGEFVFPQLQTYAYLISAEKSGFHSRVISIHDLSAADKKHIGLVLEAPNAIHPEAVSSSTTEGMAFVDKPNFTVAGITDWTAAGGHGSDSSLRTSEALARETSALKLQGSGSGDSGFDNKGGADKSEEEKLRALLRAAPDSFEANHRLGSFCFHVGSYREAIPLLETAYRIDSANRDNEYDLALTYRALGNLSRAREHIRNLLAHEERADLHRLLGDLSEESGDSLTAVHEYERAVKLDPNEQNYFAWGSELLIHRAVWPAAEVFHKGIDAHPKSARMLAALGAALFASALYDEAALRLCDASDLNPTDPAPYSFLSKIDMAAPAPLGCVEPKLMRFVRDQPENPQANYYYAMAIWKRQMVSKDQQRMQQVKDLLAKAVAVDPKYDEPYLQLGNLYASGRDFEKAIPFYRKAIEVNPELSEAHYKLGVAYGRRGESANATREFRAHDEIEKVQAAAVEQQRREVKQFLVILQGQPPVH